ncbi:unnamed protein product [Aureobasidium uvarum]|uniref:F-box domain-containing protein n=1 Tax=Aureobasidium uvarum TaxID=2773716 RepID=A0A9N8KS27_9PEZI|nr:unnamed protein product [Aureobasidium uvarum]
MTSITKLPKEIWLGVFSHLDYTVLKTCMRVNKEFKSFTEFPACQKEMFRSKAVIQEGGTIDLDNLRLHPAFDYMSYFCTGELADVEFHNSDYTNTTVLTKTCAAEEHATDPPVAYIRIQIHSWKPMQIKNKTGVTVYQVMRSLCRFFSQADYRDRLGDHFVWNGWDFRHLDDEGRLFLPKFMFDS